ncbi:MAG: hypothetical protein SWI22_02210 [Pseudomonadota bacterium]|nr:hypothetical protein [Pseudomonadota bacterium]
MKTTVSTAGFSELEAALGEFKKGTARNILRRAGLEALRPVADAMAAKAPKLEGDLKGAIGVGTKRSKGARKHFREKTTVEVYAGVKVVGGGMPPQAIQQEFGNENHGPQPFGRPAWDEEQDATLDRARDAITTQIDAATVRARRKALKAGG